MNLKETKLNHKKIISDLQRKTKILGFQKWGSKTWSMEKQSGMMEWHGMASTGIEWRGMTWAVEWKGMEGLRMME